jgi:hypothetical protein
MKLTVRQINNILTLCTLDGEPVASVVSLETNSDMDGATTYTVTAYAYADDGALMGPFARKEHSQ